ncbi:unnamed protein product [Fraxinus pennsylvanica]|uniref:Uncharacterized protein n=1 Tax=Fraxinus pennsylvanica TaxID=56036 RepID=A0AAD1YKJ8_9LAMI|nr:unnamed protein product [Fraxinus pennsylvanica]
MEKCYASVPRRRHECTEVFVHTSVHLDGGMDKCLRPSVQLDGGMSSERIHVLPPAEPSHSIPQKNQPKNWDQDSNSGSGYIRIHSRPGRDHYQKILHSAAIISTSNRIPLPFGLLDLHGAGENRESVWGPSRYKVSDMLKKGAKMGMPICRTWAFSDGARPNDLQTQPGVSESAGLGLRCPLPPPPSVPPLVSGPPRSVLATIAIGSATTDQFTISDDSPTSSLEDGGWTAALSSLGEDP